MRDIDLSIAKSAIFSEDRKYRYVLWRVWNPTRPLLLMICLNPSDANEFKNDPTITRGIVRADRNGFGGLLMANLYAFVSTNPDALWNNGNSVGELTDYYLKQMIKLSCRQLCGWGSFKPVTKRAPIVLAMIPEPYCLGINADGQPKHPLYIAYDVPMVRYNKLVKESISSPHFHHWEDGTYYSHSHRGGNVPHGHHGSRYGQGLERLAEGG